MRRSTMTVLALLACGCMVPPAPPSPHAATAVRAPAAKTWDAVIDVFAARSIPIRNMERASGFIATEEQSIGMSGKEATALADCGQNAYGYLPPTRASYNVLVRGDSSTSTVKVTARWIRSDGMTTVECSSTGTWETAFEADVKSRAESYAAK